MYAIPSSPGIPQANAVVVMVPVAAEAKDVHTARMALSFLMTV